MKIGQKLEDLIKVYRETVNLEAQIEDIRKRIERNHKLIVKYFFPYLLSAYEQWRPRIGEKAMAIDFDSHTCFEVTIDRIDGYMVRAQEGQSSNVYHRFDLNPDFKKHRLPNFIIPKSSYAEIKEIFDFEFLK